MKGRIAGRDILRLEKFNVTLARRRLLLAAILNYPFCSKDRSTDSQWFWMGRTSRKIAPFPFGIYNTQTHTQTDRLSSYWAMPISCMGTKCTKFVKMPKSRRLWLSDYQMSKLFNSQTHVFRGGFAPNPPPGLPLWIPLGLHHQLP